jgi:predicted glycosyltransferase involved in capsule biosynthesis
MITKEQFDKLGGFDESLSVYEDVEFLKRHGKQSNFGFLKKPHIYNSVRRFEQDGTIKTAMKYTLWPIYYKFLGGKKIESILGGYKMDREK